MRIVSVAAAFALALGICSAQAQSGARSIDIVPVTADNFIRAETDRYFASIVQDGGFGRFFHIRWPTPIDRQNVIRMNRDTLYSAAVFDLDAGRVTIMMPHAGDRFMSMQVISQDHYVPMVVYKAGPVTLSRNQIGTRYVAVVVRTLVDPADARDLQQVHALQDDLIVNQPGRGEFETPNWDDASRTKVRNALLVLGSTLPDSKRMFGTREEVEPVRRLIGAAMAWGGNPEKEAAYLNVTPPDNDGRTVYRLDVASVPVDGFWSISVYNREGYFERNSRDAYSINNVTAQKDANGSIRVQFGGCDDSAIVNCLPVTRGWNYIVRLYRPRAEILNGSWTFPEPQPLPASGTVGRN